MEIGDAATWAAAAVAVGAAVVSGLFSRAALRIEKQRDEQALQDRQRWQASLVSAWEDRQGGEREFPVYGVTLANASPLPIYDVTVTWFWPGPSRYSYGGITLPTVPARETFVPRPAVLSTPSTLDDGVSPDQLNGFPFTLAFRDADGTSWVRGVDGRLSEA